MSTTSTPTPPETGAVVTNEQLQAMAETFVDALLSSASVDMIGAAHWWDRAKTALETGAASSTTWAQCVTRASKKLQIETLSAESSLTIATLARTLDDPAAYQRFARVAIQNAIYTIALVRATREERRTTRAAKAKTTAAAPAPNRAGELDLFGDTK